MSVSSLPQTKLINYPIYLLQKIIYLVGVGKMHTKKEIGLIKVLKKVLRKFY